MKDRAILSKIHPFTICKMVFSLGIVIPLEYWVFLYPLLCEFLNATTLLYRTEGVVLCNSEGWLSHAILDVFDPEPLPADSALWSRHDVTVTPHVAGVGIDATEV